jgi:hypothetical protein
VGGAEEDRLISLPTSWFSSHPRDCSIAVSCGLLFFAFGFSNTECSFILNKDTISKIQNYFGKEMMMSRFEKNCLTSERQSVC